MTGTDDIARLTAAVAELERREAARTAALAGYRRVANIVTLVFFVLGAGLTFFTTWLFGRPDMGATAFMSIAISCALVSGALRVLVRAP